MSNKRNENLMLIQSNPIDCTEATVVWFTGSLYPMDQIIQIKSTNTGVSQSPRTHIVMAILFDDNSEGYNKKDPCQFFCQFWVFLHY